MKLRKKEGRPFVRRQEAFGKILLDRPGAPSPSWKRSGSRLWWTASPTAYQAARSDRAQQIQVKVLKNRNGSKGGRSTPSPAPLPPLWSTALPRCRASSGCPLIEVFLLDLGLRMRYNYYTYTTTISCIILHSVYCIMVVYTHTQ